MTWHFDNKKTQPWVDKTVLSDEYLTTNDK